jgi:hypothetical protein
MKINVKPVNTNQGSTQWEVLFFRVGGLGVWVGHLVID